MNIKNHLFVAACLIVSPAAHSQIITTVAGNGTAGFSGDTGLATSAQIFSPFAVAFDLAGNMYIADDQNHRVRKVTPAGVITTIAGLNFGDSGDGGPAILAGLENPANVAVDPAGDLFIVDQLAHKIRKVSPDGIISTFAGIGPPQNPFAPGGIPPRDGGPATQGQLNLPQGIALAPDGSVYIADTQDMRVRKVDPQGVITTVAGTGQAGYNADNIPATFAMLNLPTSVAVSGSDLYIVDSGNSRIRRVDFRGYITTIAGGGNIPCNGTLGDGGPAVSACLAGAVGLAIDIGGQIYFSDANRIRKIDGALQMSTVAGSGDVNGFYNGDNIAATSANLGSPRGLAFDSSGNLFMADTNHNRIRKVTIPADLAISQTTDPSSVAAGKDVIYAINVANAGPGSAAVSISDQIPGGAPFVWAPSNCTVSGGVVSCALGVVSAGTAAQVKIVFRPSAGGSITNMATAFGSLTDSNTANNVSSTTLSVPVLPVSPALRYRLYSPVTLEHLYTTDPNEYNVLGSYVGTWTQEGTVGHVLNNPGSFNGVVATPYYRLYNTASRWHHWTTDPNEYYTLIQFPSWNGEGVDGWILPTATTGATQLYRLNYPALPGLHHWTIDVNEYNTLVTPAYGWIGEGGSGYVIQ